MQRQALVLLRSVLRFKPGTAFYVIGGSLALVSMMLITQYRVKGRVDVRAMINRGSEMDPFWQRNPRLHLLDSFPGTSFLMVQDTPSGRSAMMDSAVVINAEVRPVDCAAFVRSIVPSDAGGLVCFEIAKPDTGAGDVYTGSASFQLKNKDADVAEFYRTLFQSRQERVTVIQDSSRGIVLESEDARGNTTARVSICSTFQVVDAFFAWTRDFRPLPA
ncbi:MAG TPA: hypothetical protein VGL72_11625 [Bryobacteraceae bacterium]|jgi:hypothetical protein